MDIQIVFVALLFAVLCGWTAWVLVRDHKEEKVLREARDARQLKRRENVLEHDTLPGPWNHLPSECPICRNAEGN